MKLTVASIAFVVGGSRSLEASLGRLGKQVHEATQRGAELVVLPELAILDALGDAQVGTTRQMVDVVADWADDYVGYLRDLSRALGVTIVGGSHLERRDEGIVNTCAVVREGMVEFVDKHILTQWESSEWGLIPGRAPRAADSLGVAICYDSEFPELIRPIAREGAKILAVPTYTETRYGYQRVRWSCQARAIENQIFVIQSSLLGSLGGEPVPTTYGRSAIFAPSVPPFPERAVLAETPLNRPGIAVAALDFDVLEASRNSGDVRNWNDYISRF